MVKFIERCCYKLVTRSTSCIYILKRQFGCYYAHILLLLYYILLLKRVKLWYTLLPLPFSPLVRDRSWIARSLIENLPPHHSAERAAFRKRLTVKFERERFPYLVFLFSCTGTFHLLLLLSSLLPPPLWAQQQQNINSIKTYQNGTIYFINFNPLRHSYRPPFLNLHSASTIRINNNSSRKSLMGRNSLAN